MNRTRFREYLIPSEWLKMNVKKTIFTPVLIGPSLQKIATALKTKDEGLRFFSMLLYF